MPAGITQRNGLVSGQHVIESKREETQCRYTVVCIQGEWMKQVNLEGL